MLQDIVPFPNEMKVVKADYFQFEKLTVTKRIWYKNKNDFLPGVPNVA